MYWSMRITEMTQMNMKQCVVPKDIQHWIACLDVENVED